MLSIVGQKRSITFGGRTWPGVVVGEPMESTVEVESRDPARAGQKTTITVLRAEIISLRETNPANGPVRQYLTITPENLRFSTPRFSTVVGLDATEDGEKISLQSLVELTEQSMADFQNQRLAAQAEVEVDLD